MKRKVLPRVYILVVALLLVAMLFAFGCGEDTPTETKTLKIGFAFYLGSTTGLDTLNCTQLLIDIDNANGGIDIGGEKYQVELIVYDSNDQQTEEVAAINKLVYEDEVDIIFNQSRYAGASLPISDEAGVLTLSADPSSFRSVSGLNYTFSPIFSSTQFASMVGWICQNHPEWEDSCMLAMPDSQLGHIIDAEITPIFEAFGFTPTIEFFPADSADLSSIGTKVATENPGCYIPLTTSEPLDCQLMTVAREAGYEGQFFLISSSTTETLQLSATDEVLEGLIEPASPTEFDPALTDTAEEFKAAWIAEYDEWTSPMVSFVNMYYCLKTALAEAGSLDVDALVAVLGNGLEFSTAMGEGQMMSRPDLGYEKTVDAASSFDIKQIVGGEPVLIDSMDIEEALELFRQAHGLTEE